MPGVFVSYRREDTGGHAGRLWEDLSQRYGEDLVFWDLERIHGGTELEQRLADEVTRCDVLVALIGTRWVTAADDGGQRRLDNPEDYVRREVAWALGARERRVPVLPVLVEGARMPSAADLPPELRPLANIAALELRNRSWPYDVDLLTKEIDSILWPPEPPAHGLRAAWRRARGALAGTPKAARRTMLAAIALTALVVALAVDASGALRSLDLSTVDTRFSLRGTRDAPEDMVIVGFDRRGLAEMGETWPPDRRVHARLIDRLREGGARVIAYDIAFTDPKTDEEDIALYDAIAEAANGARFVLAANVLDSGETVVMGGSGEELRSQTGARAAPPRVANDPGVVLRRVTYAFHGVKTFQVAVAEEDTGHPIAPFDLGGSDPWVDYAGPPGTFRMISFLDLLRRRAGADPVRNKLVVVGITDSTLGDTHSTPLSGEEAMTGPEVQANIIDTLRREAPLRSVSGAVDGLIIAFFALLGPALALRYPAARAQLAVLGAALLFLGIAYLTFSAGAVVDVVHPLLAAGVTLAGLLAVRERTAQHRKVARTREA